MDLLSIIILVLLVLWLTGALGTAPVSGSSTRWIWVILIIAIVIWLAGGLTGVNSSHWWGR